MNCRHKNLGVLDSPANAGDGWWKTLTNRVMSRYLIFVFEWMPKSIITTASRQTYPEAVIHAENPAGDFPGQA